MLRFLAVRVTSIGITLPAMLVLGSVPADAQAFLPAQGEGSVAVVFQDFSMNTTSCRRPPTTAAISERTASSSI